MTEKQRTEVLRQVERGELSVDDAIKILEDADREERAKDREDHMAEIRTAVSDVLHEVSDSLKGAGEVVNDVFTDVGKDLRENQDLRSALSGLFSGLFALGGGHTYEYVHEGVFDAEEIRVVLRGKNGKLQVKNWEGEGYKLSTKVSVKAVSEADAKSLAKDAYVLNVKPGELQMEVKPTLRNGGVSAELLLPAGKDYNLILETSNGSVKVEDITGEGLEIRTSNGAVVLNGGCFTHTNVNTSNGSVNLTGSCGETKIETSNGSIRVDAAGAGDSELELSTSNGSITLVVDDEPDTGYSINAATSNGRISADVHGLNIVAKGKNQFTARSENYDKCSKHTRIVARTSNGRINISHQQ